MNEKAKLLNVIDMLESNMRSLLSVQKKQIEIIQNINDILATIEVMEDKELYETIMTTDENSELYDEEDINW